MKKIIYILTDTGVNKLMQTTHGKYLFNHKVLAKVFQGKLLSKLAKENLILPKVTSKVGG